MRARGRRPHGTGTETYCRVNGEWRSTWWPAGTPDHVMDAWLKQQRKDRAPRAGRRTFAKMVPDYLLTQVALPSYKDRARDIGYWGAEFGHLSPYAIDRALVQAVLQRWERDGVAVSTIRHRRSALSSFFETMLPDADNPALSAKAPTAPKRKPRALPIPLLEAIIAKMPDVTKSRKGEKRATGSQSKARMRVFIYTGIPPKQMTLLKPDDLHLNETPPRVFVQARRKGGGHEPEWLPLLPQAVEAFREWVRLDCWGTYSTSSVRMSFRRAAVALQKELMAQGQMISLGHVTPYLARHSFATHALTMSNGNAPGVQKLMLHSTLAQTMEYAKAGLDPLALAVVEALKMAE